METRNPSRRTPEPSRWCRALGAAALCAALPWAGARVAGQELAEEPAAGFEEEVWVEVVSLEVFVTDRRGRPVTGLTREHFQLRENGRPMEITYFAAFDEGSAAAAGPEREEESGPEPAAAAPREARNLVIYLDDANLGVGGRRRVLADLREVVATGGDGADQLMVVVHDGSLAIVQPFTEDREAVVAALDGLARRATGGIFRTTERASAVRSIREIYRGYQDSPQCPDPCLCGWMEMEAQARQYAGAVEGHVSAATGALSQIASALAGVAGRKFVLYVGDGLEQQAGIDLFHFVADICPQYERDLARNYLSYDQSSAFNRLTAHANANGVTLHTLEALGLQADADIAEADPRLRASGTTRRIESANRQAPLYGMANESGGRAILNANTFAGEIRRIAGDYETYYSLGFASRHRGDGRLRRLQVEVAGRGYQVRHRTYYQDKPLQTRLAERVWGTLLLGTGTNPLGAELEPGPARIRGGRCCAVPVEIRLPHDRLSLVPAADAALGRVYVVLAAKDAAGKTLPVKGREIPIRAAPGEETAASRLVVEIDLAPGAHELAVGILDLVGGGEAYLRQAVEVAPPAGGGPAE